MKRERHLVSTIITLLFLCGALCQSEGQPSARDDQALKDQEECTANLKQMLAAIRTYRSDHNGLRNLQWSCLS